MSKAAVVGFVPHLADLRKVSAPAIITAAAIASAERAAARRKPICNGCLSPRRGVQRKASGCSTVCCPHHGRCFLCRGETDGRFVLVPAS